MLLATSLMDSSNSASPRGPRLRLVCINDVYTLENLPRLKTLVKAVKEADPADLFLTTLAGDFVAPSMLSSLDAGRGMVDCMNDIPVTHVCFGNHEDDIPLAELRLRTAQFTGTWLDTNVRGVSSSLPTHQVMQVIALHGRTVRVGLLGVVMTDETVYRGQPFGNSVMVPANQAAKKEAARLIAEEQCAIVIPMTHQSMDEDRALASDPNGPHFPLIVGGHEHQVFLEQVAGTWIVKAAADAVHAVVVDLVWPVNSPAEGADVPTVSIRLEDVATYEEDSELRARVDNHMKAVHALEAATLQKLVTGERLSSVGTRVQQTSLGTLVCSRVRDTLGAEGCIFNGGGIRASRHYENRFTYGDLKAEVPFDNEVVVAKIPGSVLRAAITESRGHAPLESGGFLQVDDQMSVEGTTLVEVAGEPLDDNRDYRIALVRNLFTGMDHISTLVEFAQACPGKIPPVGSGREVKEVLVHAFSIALWDRMGGFDAVDADHDGTVTAQEIAAAVCRVTAEPASDVTVDLLMHAIDKNHDDKISREEANAEKVQKKPRPVG